MRIAVLLGMLMSTALFLSAEEVTGWLADSKCAAGGKGASNAHAACAKKCVEGGADIVVVTADKKVYKITNQDTAKPYVGSKATLTGKIEGDSITVEKGKPAE